ncbi:MAG: ATP-binding cassette domain-containing protein, partial [Candidatus Aenigmatarchaeota archaeon]
VRENIGYGNPDVESSRIETVAKSAGAHEFIKELPNEYDTLVGERGVKLSGGQRQRVSIARAILNNPPILILDEATSHVDNETEARIQSNLKNLSSNPTTFIVAHRLSTVRNADRIFVLDEGRIVERGTHEELLSKEGIYSDLWNIQVKNSGDF